MNQSCARMKIYNAPGLIIQTILQFMHIIAQSENDPISHAAWILVVDVDFQGQVVLRFCTVNFQATLSTIRTFLPLVCQAILFSLRPLVYNFTLCRWVFIQDNELYMSYFNNTFHLSWPPDMTIWYRTKHMKENLRFAQIDG